MSNAKIERVPLPGSRVVTRYLGWYRAVVDLFSIRCELFFDGAVGKKVFLTGRAWLVGYVRLFPACIIRFWIGLAPVSYTHLTLPTKRIV